jgi:hypothetical protein
MEGVQNKPVGWQDQIEHIVSVNDAKLEWVNEDEIPHGRGRNAVHNGFSWVDPPELNQYDRTAQSIIQ